MAKKLVIDIEKFEDCERKLREYAEELTNTQKTLQTAMETLVNDDGWKSTGSSEFEKKYNESWVAGINDRHDVIIRLADHIQEAIKEYKPIVDEVEALKNKINM